MKLRGESSSRSSSKLLKIIATFYLIFVFYGSWVPLHFTPRPFSEALLAFVELHFFDQTIDSATDWATNFLLLIPLTFLWAQRLLPERRGFASLALRLAVIGLGVAIAFALEFSQIYFPPRTVSQKDVMALSLGSVVGVVAQYRWGSSVENWLDMVWQRESQQGRVIRMLHVYLLVLFAFSVLPLDLTLSPVELYRKWSEGGVVLIPFRGLKGGFFDNLYETATDLLIWLPVGFFLTLNRKASLFRVAIVGWLAGAVIEVAQLFVYSRVTDVTDVLLAGVGTASGGWLGNRRRKAMALFAKARPGFWLLLWGGWFVTVLCLFWFPFNFRATGVTLDTVYTAFTRLPFLMLYQGSELNAVNEMLRKIGFFLPGGVIWGLGIAAIQTRKDSIWSRLNGIAVFAAVALIVEGGQLFLPGKYVDLTDVLLKTAGGFWGMILIGWVLAGSNITDDQLVPSNEASIQITHQEATSRQQNAMFHDWTNHLITFIGLTLLVSIITRLHIMPYNVRELNAPGIAGVFSSLGLAMVIYWIANGHFFILRGAVHDRLLALPAWLVVNAFLAWAVIRLTIPMESIHDILGTPVLNWAWESELIGRYLALHVMVTLQAAGAAIFLSIVYRRGNLASLIVWLTFSFMLAWPLHWIIVEAAATDNLTELMRNGGSFFNSAILASGVLAFFITGGAAAAIVAEPVRCEKALVWAVIATLVATAAFWFGSEQVIVKYGKVFSTWQFLLSTSRESYANGPELVIRYLGAYAFMVGVLGLLQASHFKALRKRQQQ